MRDELTALCGELGEALADLVYLRAKTQPQIHLRGEVNATWEAVLERLAAVENRLGELARSRE